MDETPLYTYGRFGFSLRLYPNRIEVAEGPFGMKRETVLLRSVTDVSAIGFTGRLSVTTADGRARNWRVGWQAERARAAILAALP